MLLTRPCLFVFDNTVDYQSKPAHFSLYRTTHSGWKNYQKVSFSSILPLFSSILPLFLCILPSFLSIKIKIFCNENSNETLFGIFQGYFKDGIFSGKFRHESRNRSRDRFPAGPKFQIFQFSIFQFFNFFFSAYHFFKHFWRQNSKKFIGEKQTFLIFS